jgi:hypothetical protein
MGMGELDRLKVVQALVDGLLKSGSAARKLGLTVRQIHRLVMRYRAEGPSGLESRRRNRPSNNQIYDEIAQIALTIISIGGLTKDVRATDYSMRFAQ